MRKFLLIIHILLCSKMLQAQLLTVQNKTDLQPLEGVSIFINKTFISITDAKGQITLTNVNASDSIYFRKLGYQPLAFTYMQLQKNAFKVELTESSILMNEVVLSANKSPENKNNQPTEIEVVTQRQIAFRNPQTAADLLAQTGKIFVQQSQMGGGSPVLRGFEANKVLLVIDGVRMNNAIYRGGHLQNAITIDPNILDRAEIVFGPGSVTYGSDALGGVIHYYTMRPQLAYGEMKHNIKANAFVRYGSANNEKTAHVNLNLGFRKIAWLAGVTVKDFGDLRSGSVNNPLYPDFGKRPFYVKRIDGKDSIFQNQNPDVQVGSAYSQTDAISKLLFTPTDKWTMQLNGQLSVSSDIPRYDRLTEVSSGKPRFAEWYYGPQFRSLVSFTNEFTNRNAVYDKLNIILAYQFIEESRIDRRLNAASRNNRIEKVDVYSATADAIKSLGKKNELHYGVEINHNKVNSTAFKEKITDNSQSPLDTRYPSGGSTMQTAAFYATHSWKISPKFIFSQGIRETFIKLNAKFSDTSFFKFPFTEANQKSQALNGNMAFVFLPDSSWKISLIGSTGFRAPNVDDMAKVFETSAGNDSVLGTLVLPNPDVKPEFTYNAEINVAKSFKDIFYIEGCAFYTWYKDALVIRPAGYTLMYQGNLSNVVTLTNAQNAELYGLQGEIRIQPHPVFSFASSLTYTHGKVLKENVPLDHIPPVFGQTSLRMNFTKFKAEFFVRYNGWKRIEDFSKSGEDNPQYALAQGYPSWYTLNLRTDYQLTKNLKLQAGVENILDLHYRNFASGISAPGRNLFVSLRANI